MNKKPNETLEMTAALAFLAYHTFIHNPVKELYYKSRKIPYAYTVSDFIEVVRTDKKSVDQLAEKYS